MFYDLMLINDPGFLKPTVQSTHFLERSFGNLVRQGKQIITN